MVKFNLGRNSNQYKRYSKDKDSTDIVVDLTFPVPLSSDPFYLFFKFGNIDNLDTFEDYFNLKIEATDYNNLSESAFNMQRISEEEIDSNTTEYCYKCIFSNNLQDLYNLKIYIENKNQSFGFGDYDLMWDALPFPRKNPDIIKLYAWQPNNDELTETYPIFYFDTLLPNKNNHGTVDSILKGKLLKSLYDKEIDNRTLSYVSTKGGILPEIKSTNDKYTSENDVRNLELKLDINEVENSEEIVLLTEKKN